MLRKIGGVLVINYIRKLFRKIQILNNNRKLKFEIIIKDIIPRIKVQEKNEKRVKWSIRIIAIAGIVLSAVSFSMWYYAVGASIGIFLISQILEKIIYTYTVMIVQPLPQKWDGSKWSMMVVGMYHSKYVLAFGFNDKEVAVDFFNTILHWNNNEMVNEKNINISLVLEDKDNYSVHVYPDIEREFVIDSINETEEHFKYDKYGKNQTSLVMQVDICKVFPNGPNSAFNLLRDYNDDVYISIYDTSQFCENKPKTINLIHPFDDRKILCKNIKVLKRNELDKQKETMEYFHIPV